MANETKEIIEGTWEAPIENEALCPASRASKRAVKEEERLARRTIKVDRNQAFMRSVKFQAMADAADAQARLIELGINDLSFFCDSHTDREVKILLSKYFKRRSFFPFVILLAAAGAAAAYFLGYLPF